MIFYISWWLIIKFIRRKSPFLWYSFTFTVVITHEIIIFQAICIDKIPKDFTPIKDTYYAALRQTLWYQLAYHELFVSEKQFSMFVSLWRFNLTAHTIYRGCSSYECFILRPTRQTQGCASKRGYLFHFRFRDIMDLLLSTLFLLHFSYWSVLVSRWFSIASIDRCLLRISLLWRGTNKFI